MNNARLRVSVIGPFRIFVDMDEPLKLPRRSCHVIAGLAISPDHAMLRKDITEIVWPMSEGKSRDVLLHQTRRTIAAAFEKYDLDAPITFIDRVIKLDTSHIAIDFVEAKFQSTYALLDESPSVRLRSACAFDDIVGGNILLADFGDTFHNQRADFNRLRHSVLLEGYKAAIQLGERHQSTRFKQRLHDTGYSKPLPVGGLGDAKSTITVLEAELVSGGLETASQDRLTAPLRLLVNLERRYQIWITGFMLALLTAIIVMPRILPSTNGQKSRSEKNVNRVFFSFSPPKGFRSTARALAMHTNGDVVVLTNSYSSNNAPTSSVCRITKQGAILWSAPINLPGFERTQLSKLLTDPEGNTYGIGKTFIRADSLVSLSKGWHPVILRISSAGEISNASFVPSLYSDDVADIQFILDKQGGTWASVPTNHRLAGNAAAVCHISRKGNLESVVVMSKHNPDIRALVPTSAGSVIVIGMERITHDRKSPKVFLTRLSTLGKTEWYTELDGSISHAIHGLRETNGTISLVLNRCSVVTAHQQLHERDPLTDRGSGLVTHTRSLVSSKSGTIDDLAGLDATVIDTTTGMVTEHVKLDFPVGNRSLDVALAPGLRDILVASTSLYGSKPATIQFGYGLNSHTNSAVMTAIDIPFAVRILSIPYIAYDGGSQFRALVNVQSLSKAGKSGVVYVRKDKGKDIEVTHLDCPMDIEPENFDSGVIAVNTEATYKLMKINSLK